ncbi:MAG: AAA family ATPase [Myxococcales bacterium]|nr:AAA family ATPase [Myxococcales bacterium]
MEYLKHFGIEDDPFCNESLESFQLELSPQTDALKRLERGVRQGRRLVVLLGGVGCGKTTVARRLYEELEEEHFAASMTVVLQDRPEAGWMLNHVAKCLGVESEAEGREARIAQIYDRLVANREAGLQSVLIIDDAQALANRDALVELCGLVKLESEDRGLLSLVLVGSHELGDAIGAEAGLLHEVEVRVELRGLDADEFAGYLAGRVKAAGGDPRILAPDALAALGQFTAGAPGLANVVADNALFEAFLQGRSEITQADVVRAHSALAWVASPGSMGVGQRTKNAGFRDGSVFVSQSDLAEVAKQDGDLDETSGDLLGG